MSATCSSEKKVYEDEMATWRCPECLEIEKGAQRNNAEKISAEHLKTALNFIWDHLIADDKIFTKQFMEVDYPRGTVANTMDLNTISKKIEIGAYSCCEDFYSDIKWIVHNTKIHCSANHGKIKAANVLFNAVKEEMYCIRLCHSCYINLDVDWFSTPCARLHILVWAKQRTFPYWPAKVMRYNRDQNTVDVQYFGGSHLRGIVPVKNCLLYSQRCPSIWIGPQRREHNEAMKEAESYINNLIKKYGSFNYADAITVLHGNFLERHLYEMIPNAWKELGHSVVPPPIPKSKPASATCARRMSLPVKQTKRNSPVPQEVYTTGCVMTRRMSASVAASDVKIVPNITTAKIAPNTTTAESATNTQIAASCRQLSIQIDRLPSTTNNLSSFIQTTMAKGSDGKPQTATKKRMNSVKLNKLQPAKCAKMAVNVNQDAAPSSTTSLQYGSGSSQNSTSDTVFKVPAVPKARRSTLSSRKLAKKADHLSCDNRKIITNEPDSSLNNEIVSNGKPSSPCADSTEFSNSTAQFEIDQVTVEMLTTSEPVVQNAIQHSTGVTQLCVEMIDKSTQTLNERQLDNKRLIDGLRDENSTLKADLKKYKEMYLSAMHDQASEEANVGNVFKSKLDAVSADLEKAQAKITEANQYVNQLGTTSTQNANLKIKIAKLQAANVEFANNLKNAEAKNTHLTHINRNLIKSSTEIDRMKSTIERLSTEKNRLSSQVTGLQKKCELAKEQAHEQYEKMLRDVKQKKWCAMCLRPAGPYYCSACDPRHERNTWQQSRRYRNPKFI
ncbi:MYND-type zinc finger-containing chromatin reader ZMYND8-like [Sitodiplosis mosellana]|uniref:MYND-type zinc finger-containing chromatin reader ZMYND8-like n=1 Tax=Sitodiplosis mosellana TaxID=263140 RepID=UPI002443BF1E|nr:MYND-type zinc finger-containing chromatin reader ZMYND8-like [Sitodiplosis mosellana]